MCIRDRYVGGVAGYVDHSISECSNAATVTASSSKVGGITGHMFGQTMLKCYNTGSVTGASLVGGLTGCIYNNGTVDSCYNTGAVLHIVCIARNAASVFGCAVNDAVGQCQIRCV